MILNNSGFSKYGEQVLCVLLFIPPFFGFIHRKINNVKLRKWSSTIIGLFSMLMLCDGYLSRLFLIVLHTVTMCIILMLTHRKYIRFVALYAILTLTIYRCYVEDEMKYNLFTVDLVLLAITGRIMGISFDMYYSYESQKNKYHNDNTITFKDYITDPSMMDTFHYLFSYMTPSGGIFYRYRTFEDCMHKRFWKKSFDKTVDKKLLLECILLYIFYSFYLPHHHRTFHTSYFTTDEYLNSNILDMCLVMIKLGIGFNTHSVLFIYITELNCKTSGLGYYPVRCNNISGHGPSTNYKELSELSPEAMEQETFDYLTVKSFYFNANISPWLLVHAKYWNKTQEYWITRACRNIAISLPWIPKVIVIILLSYLWHGIHLGILIAFIATGIFLKIQYPYWRIHEDFLKDKGWITSAFLWLNFVIKIICIGFYTCFYILTTWENIFFYMGKIYFAPLFFSLLFYVIGIILNEYLKFTKQTV